MLREDITYEDYNGDTVTETHYFNMTKTELIELEVEHNEGLDAWIKHIMESNDRKVLVSEFKKIISACYGQKSPDGKLFIKNEELRDQFLQSAAFDVLFLKLISDEDFSARFVKGILPKDLAGNVDKAVAERQLNVASPPAVPTPPNQ